MQTAYSQSPGAAAPPSAADEQKHLLAYAPLVHRVVKQLTSQLGAAMGRDDMQQIGLLGLLTALRRYGEPDGGFASYATLRVRGAILDELRSQDWRPRAVRQESHRARDQIRGLARRLGREPTYAEVLKELDLTPQEYRDYELAENAEQLANFDEVLESAPGTSSTHCESPEGKFVTRRGIEEALRALDERERRVIQLYYEFELSLKEIAAVLDLSEARICQINKGALKKMKDLLR
jgi:RNA polymerase sigma factor FliA